MYGKESIKCADVEVTQAVQSTQMCQSINASLSILINIPLLGVPASSSSLYFFTGHPVELKL